MYHISEEGIASTLLWNGSADRQLVSHPIIGPVYLTQSCLQTEQLESDQDHVKMVVPKISRVSSNDQTLLNGKQLVIASQNPNFVLQGRKAVNISANQNLPNSYLKLELTTMHGE